MMQKQELPSGWRKQKLADLANVKGGKRLPKGRSLVSENTGYPYIRVTDMHDGGVSLENVLFIPQDIVAKISRYRIFTEDIFITVAGTLGVVGEIPQELNGANLTENADRITDINCDKKFLLQVLRSSFIQGIIKSTQTQNAQPKLAIERINTFPILLPPQPEQKAIADLLSTWDEAIEKTERLIQAKERQLRQMSKWLLFGHKRLGNQKTELADGHFFNYPSDWALVKIGKVAREVSARNGESEETVLSCSKYDGFVNSLDYFEKQVFSSDTSNYKVVKKGQFGYPSNHVEEGSIGLLEHCEKGIVSPIYVVFEASKEKVHSPYLYKLLKTDIYRHIFQVSTSSSVDRRGSLRWGDFSKIKVLVPSLEEQQEIAETLSSAQHEIALLKQLAEKYKTQKRGLMQKMLTGEWRVRGFATNDEG